MITAIVVRLAYGKKILSADDSYVVVAEKAIHGLLQACIPGTFWIDFLPFLKWIPSWFPGAHFKRHAEEYSPYVVNLRDRSYEEVKATMASAEG